MAALERSQLPDRHAVVVLELGQHLAHGVVAGQLAGAVGDDGGDPLAAQPAHEEAQEVLGRAVHPVDVLEHHQHRRLAPERAQQHHQGLEHARLRETVSLRTAAHRNSDREVRERALELAADLGAEAAHRLLQGAAGGVAQQRRERRVGQLAAVEAQAVAAQHRRAALAAPALGLAHEPGLADPGLPHQQRHARLAHRGRFDRRLQRRALVLAVHDAAAREARSHGRIIPAAPVAA